MEQKSAVIENKPEEVPAASDSATQLRKDGVGGTWRQQDTHSASVPAQKGSDAYGGHRENEIPRCWDYMFHGNLRNRLSTCL